MSAYLLLKWVKFWPESTLTKRHVGRHMAQNPVYDCIFMNVL